MSPSHRQWETIDNEGAQVGSSSPGKGTMWEGVIHNKHLTLLGRMHVVQAGLVPGGAVSMPCFRAVRAAERRVQVIEQAWFCRLQPGAKHCKLKVLKEHAP